jgi:hypothetical protein
MAGIRSCTPDDLPTVARLFQSAFRHSATPAPSSLETCLRQIFFEHPWYDPDISSRVYVGRDGFVRGFIGAVPLHMRLGSRAVRAAVPSSLMVERPDEDPLAGAKLVRSFLTGPQDISISEPLNQVSEGMWQRLGGISVPSESMEWLRILRPAGLGLALAGDRYPFLRLLRPLAVSFDFLAQIVMTGIGSGERGDTQPAAHGPNPRAARHLDLAHDEEAGDGELFAATQELAGTYALHPHWDAACLSWQVGHAAQNRGRGTLFRRIVYGKAGAPIGCYLYHGRPAGIAWVLQVLTRPDTAGPVLDSLFAHAQQHGSVAIKGRSQLRLLSALQQRRCIFFRRNSAMVHSRDPHLLAAVRAGDAITSGLAGETWMRLIGDIFE